MTVFDSDKDSMPARVNGVKARIPWVKTENAKRGFYMEADIEMIYQFAQRLWSLSSFEAAKKF